MPDQRLQRLKNQAHAILLQNRRTTGAAQYTIPSPTSYPYQWLWDSCFHAIILTHFSLADAKKELRSLLSKQFANGLIPHMIYWEKNDVLNIDWGKADTSSITQPPMIAYAAWRIFEKDQDRTFLSAIYPHLYHYYNYLLTERDPRRHHLAGIINPDESGEDDSPRFDETLGLAAQHAPEENLQRRLALIAKNKTCNFDAPFCMKNFFWVKDVPFNAILVENLSKLALIANRLGRPEEALFFREQEVRVTRAMRDQMMKDGLFWSTFGQDYQQIPVKTWALFAPLFAGISTPDEARILVEEYLRHDKYFAAPFSVPTVSLDEPSFNPNGFWRGPVWLAPNWFIHQGLIRYGYREDAERIREHTAKLLDQSGFREYFNPHSGAGLGAQNFTWGGLIVDMYAGI
ncbi:MAG: hypothetical protein HY372_02030 [Candidatus Andersenbacteria bacterium]|nr:hypothetical protein [Candidatus Andersenbacteria bacterium]